MLIAISVEKSRQVRSGKRVYIMKISHEGSISENELQTPRESNNRMPDEYSMYFFNNERAEL